MDKQLDEWRGDFGKAYTDRNVVDWRTRVGALQGILGGLEIMSVLEIGCNRGHNLAALRDVLGPACSVAGVEPQEYARSIAHQDFPDSEVREGTVYSVPFEDATFDLVLTSGVLIHVPLDRLDTALSEVRRLSRRYVLAIEYFAEEETTIEYRGHDDLLWKRDFGAHYQRLFPALTLISTGDLTLEEGFDDARWWLFAR